ncbi:unnamed protein product [Rotaria sp. Silwood1]|nr:unnamed protein product [Rotaria sp. Silwood1]CAF3671713.1 unnamed protein product [Rotaria sp. Silwood1]
MMLDFQEQVTKAEAVWALTVARRGYSFNSCDEIGDVFRTMFPDSKIAQQFSMQSRKVSYVLSHGLGPYFHAELIKCLKKTEKFVLCFDEQTNNQNRKQLDLLVKYWCYSEGLVVTRYYKSILLRHATASVLKNVFIDSLKADGLELKQLLMLGHDSPFINLSFENLIDNEMKKIGCGLLKIGGCNLHIAHNGFKTGLTVLAVPFLTPALRRHALPYVPATREQLDNIFNLLKQYSTKQRQHLIDLGSGDGRIVFEAIQQGFPRATGIEINRVLVYYARLKAYLSNQGNICKFKRANLWKHDLSKYDTIVLFGVDTMMEPLLKKLSKEISDESIVITCRYQFPIKFDRTVGEDIDAVWLYNSQTIRKQILKT